jgi:MFS family permease
VIRREETSSGPGSAIVLAWLFTALFYFYQYVLRSAPAVMMPELTAGYGMTAAGLATLVAIFYYGYAIFSLISGVAIDQLGPRYVVPGGCAAVAIGALLFGSGDAFLGAFGRFLQGAGGVFALIGAAYLVTRNFPASRAATLLGATQMFGMAGGSAGQFLVGPAIAGGLSWHKFWIAMGALGFAGGILLFLFIPPQERDQSVALSYRARSAGSAIKAVFLNPQSILCGLVAGLLFLPTTIFDMVWGVRFLQEGHDMSYAEAVMRSASVPFGWIIGCPLLGAISDRIGRRKPVIIGGALIVLATFFLILFVPRDMFPAYSLGLVAGIGSGAAMIPYTVIKEANRPEHGGTATGVINFINFSLSALLGPAFGSLLVHLSAGGERGLEHYQLTFTPLVVGVGLAILFAFLLRETGPAARRAATADNAPAPSTWANPRSNP